MSAQYLTPALAELLMALGQQPQERTRVEVFELLGLDDEEYFLTKLATADRMLRGCGVEVQPSLQNEPPDGTFVLRRRSVGASSEAAIRDRLAGLARLRQLGPLTDDNLLIFRDRTPKGRHYTERPGAPPTRLQDSSFGAGCFGNAKSS